MELRSALLRWFDAHRRDLPWRYLPGETPDPYRVWLSEVMLQQTRVETVKPYFDRWTARFPSLAALAEAEIDDVLKGWEGLGYYSRARNFHAAVREVAVRYDGKVPADPIAFRALPGVGAYTAGAVMSIAFGRPEPVVDGNVRRVFARLMDTADPSPKALWELAERLVAGERPGDLNQAMMELGALICTPRAPACDVCPVAASCASRAAGTQAETPRKRKRAPVPVEQHGVAIVSRAGRLLLVRRPEGGRLGGLWEFPGSERREGESAAAAAVRAARELGGVMTTAKRPAATVEHVFSHVRVVYDAWFMDQPTSGTHGEHPAAEGVRWVDAAELSELALPTAQLRILAVITPEASLLPVVEGEAPLDLG